VENGRNIKNWGDKWLPSPMTHAIQTLVCILDFEAKVCELIDQDTNWWIMHLIRKIFMEEEVKIICGMPICPYTQQDRAVRAGNESGLF
jgi:hypothetical protein